MAAPPSHACATIGAISNAQNVAGTTAVQSDGQARRRRAVVIEDDADIRLLLTRVLAQAGLEVSEAGSGTDGLDEVRRCQPDLVTLDLNLPDMDGIEVCRQLREQTDAYVIMLTARQEEIDRLLGLEVGADDYVTKPFSPRELRARVAAMFRRPRPVAMAASASSALPLAAPVAPPARVVTAAGFEVDLDAHEVRRAGQVLPLTLTEFRIFAALAAHPGQVWTREALLREVWDTSWTDNTHLVDVHVGNLRRKLGATGTDGRAVRTVRGVGYRLGTG